MKNFPVAQYKQVIDTPEYEIFRKNNQTYIFPTKPIVSKDFKNLFTKMFLEDPEKRISLTEIAAHKWVTKDELPSEKELNDEISRLKKVRQGEINEWAKTDGDSFAVIRSDEYIKRAASKYDYIDVAAEY
jgi:serine/threonine protein kinase